MQITKLRYGSVSRLLVRSKRDPAMQTNFDIFGPAHIAILSTIPVLAAILVAIERWTSAGRRALRIGLAFTLLLNSIVRYGYLAARGWFTFHSCCNATRGPTASSAIMIRWPSGR